MHTHATHLPHDCHTLATRLPHVFKKAIKKEAKKFPKKFREEGELGANVNIKNRLKSNLIFVKIKSKGDNNMTGYQKLKAKLAIYEELINSLDSDFREMINNPDSFADYDEKLTESEKKLMQSLSHYFSHEIYLHEKRIWILKEKEKHETN